MTITVLVDNESWILPYAKELVNQLNKRSLKANLIRSPEEIPQGDTLFLLGCVNMLQPHYLKRNTINLVVHESDLPKGRGFAPISWQILEGKSRIAVCLIEAKDMADSGEIWLKEYIDLDGTELCQEWRHLQGEKTIEICLKFCDQQGSLSATSQSGSPTFYKRRSPKDSKLDPNKTIAEQFNLFRVVDNHDYPAFFTHNGRKYQLEIKPYDDES